jgi:hypothetical protein
MEADEGRRLVGVEVTDDRVADLPVELLKGVGLGVDRGGSCAGPEGAVLRFLDHEKDFLHGALQWHQSGSGGRDAALVWAEGLGRHTNPQSQVGCSRQTPTPEGSQQGRLPDGPPKTTPGPNALQPPPCPMPPHPSPTYERLRDTIAQRMRMSPIDQPLML